MFAFVPAEKLAVAPDCGLSQTARWASRQKLINMVKGAKKVRADFITMSSSALIPAFCKGVELQKQIHYAKENAADDHFDIWWLGQSGFLIQWNRIVILFDPYLSDSLTKKYADTNKPHVRMSELVINPLLLDNIDIVTSSHNHTDHLDAETLIPLLQVNPEITFIIPEANREFVIDRMKCPARFSPWS